MCDPVIKSNQPLQAAMSEIISAVSALNMYPDPLNNGKEFLSENDGWAKHAVEHMHAALELVHAVEQEMEKLKWEHHRLRLRIAESRNNDHQR